MKFSLLIPTRKRVGKLQNLLESIERTTLNVQDIEVILAVDEDDRETLEYQWAGRFPIRKMIRKQSDNLSNDYFNWMAQHSEGEIIWLLNDDCVFYTQDWDLLARAYIEYFGWEIFLGDPVDNYRGIVEGVFSSFPMISRKAYEAIGYVLPPKVRTWGADAIMYEIFQKVGRIIWMRDIFVQHNKDKDENWVKMRNAWVEDCSSKETEVDFGRISIGIGDELARLNKALEKEGKNARNEKTVVQGTSGKRG